MVARVFRISVIRSSRFAASLVWLVQPNIIYAMAVALLIVPSLARFLAVTR